MEELASPFSPQLATARVHIKQDPCGQGRWISCGLLRPFVPMDMSEDSAVTTVAQMLDEGRHNPTVGSRARRVKHPQAEQAGSSADQDRPAESTSGKRRLVAPMQAAHHSAASAWPSAIAVGQPQSGLVVTSVVCRRGCPCGGRGSSHARVGCAGSEDRHLRIRHRRKRPVLPVPR